MAASGKAQVDGRRAIFITGAASGIGLSTALRFARGGWFVGLRVSLRNQKAPVYPVEEVSDAVWAAVHGKPQLHHLVGGQAKQLGLLNRLLPNLVRTRLQRQVEAL